MVLQAGSAGRAAALEELCRLYWRPLFCYCRIAGHPEADAEDLTQGYFEHLLSREAIGRADPARGRFRTFLLSSFRNYQTDLHRQRTAARRGGGQVHLSLEKDVADSPLTPPSAELSPELAFDRQWASDLIQRAKDLLKAEQSHAGRGEWYERVVLHAGQDYASLAPELDTTVAALKTYAHRVRQRFRALVERQVADTVASPDDLAEEMRYLSHLLRQPG
jgi:RNA polymerase sigma factor (sigma-70 family)